MKAPAFWYRSPGFAAALLAPAAAAYGAVARRRWRGATPVRAAVPVLCIGNLVAGGAGKTPVALSVLAQMRDRGIAAHALTRGYGGRLAGPVQVDLAVHDAGAVGDEAMLLAAAAPTWVARYRPAGAAAAADSGAAAVVMDDGFQNPSLAKDLSILVVDGGVGFGNGRLLPAGPLRESVSAGLARAQAAVVLGTDRVGVGRWLADGGWPVLTGRLVPVPGLSWLREGRVVAFAGIGRPAKFFDMLVASGADVAAARAFPDHHRFSADEMMRLLDMAATHGAMLVTTAKDYARLAPDQREMVRPVPIRIAWDDADQLTTLIARLFDDR